MAKYNFDAAKVCDFIVDEMKVFVKKIGTKTIVLGLSGGKDSTVCAALAAKAIGRENVYGVMMPNGVQADIDDSIRVAGHLGIKGIEINVNTAYMSILNQIHDSEIEIKEDTKINLPPRLRMSTLYAVGQSVNGLVLNCDNIEELYSGYYSIFGDGAGSYGPIRCLTVPEVIKVGRHLGLPEDLLVKKPGDGLQPLGDEDRLGFTYLEMHDYIRLGQCSEATKAKIEDRYKKNQFKTDMIRIPKPEVELHFNLPNIFDWIYDFK